MGTKDEAETCLWSETGRISGARGIDRRLPMFISHLQLSSSRGKLLIVCVMCRYLPSLFNISGNI